MAAAAVKLHWAEPQKMYNIQLDPYLLLVLSRKLEALKSYNFNWNSCIWKVNSHPRPVYEHFKDKAVWAKLQPEPDNDQESIQ